MITCAHNVVQFNTGKPLFAKENSRFYFQRHGKENSKYEMSITKYYYHPRYVEDTDFKKGHDIAICEVEISTSTSSLTDEQISKFSKDA